MIRTLFAILRFFLLRIINFSLDFIAANHIDIPNVSLKRNDQNKNDLIGLIKDTWSLDFNHVKFAAKPGESEIVTDGTLAAYGTFARTYGSEIADTETSFTVDKTKPILYHRCRANHGYRRQQHRCFRLTFRYLYREW